MTADPSSPLGPPVGLMCNLLAVDLMMAPTDRSWRYMLEQDATMTWEAWANHYKPNQDWNHAWGAAPANIIPRKLMGVEPTAPGFAGMRIAPRPSDLAHASLTMPAIRGPVRVTYAKTGGAVQLEVELPPNTTAEVMVPPAGGRASQPVQAGSGVHRFGG